MSTTLLDMRTWSGRDILSWFAIVAGPACLFCFSMLLWSYGMSENIASFSLWGVIDGLFCYNMWMSGSKRDAIFPGLYTVIVIITVAIIYKNGTWQWGAIETVCSILVIGALIATKISTRLAIVASGIAITMASIPILIDSFQHPEPWTWWFWISGTISGWVLYFLTPDRSLSNVSSWLFNLLAAVMGTIITLINTWPALSALH